MILEPLITESQELEKDMVRIIAGPLWGNTARYRISDTLCDLSLEHWAGFRGLMINGFITSSFVILRTQFEVLVRSIWLLHAASDHQVERLNRDLNLETEQAAKNIPTVYEMMRDLEKAAPSNAFPPLREFQENSMKALHSYTHGGLHPIRRKMEGKWPIDFLQNMIRQSNGLAALASFHAVNIRGNQPLQKVIKDLLMKYPNCFSVKQ